MDYIITQGKPQATNITTTTGQFTKQLKNQALGSYHPLLMYLLVLREYFPNVDKNEAKFYTIVLVNQYYM